jgi:hypothetical protein
LDVHARAAARQPQLALWQHSPVFLLGLQPHRGTLGATVCVAPPRERVAMMAQAATG